MARWSYSQYQDVIGRGRMDGEYHSHPAHQIEKHLDGSHMELCRLRDCCERITSGHTPLRHDLTSGEVFFVTVECVSPLRINYELAKRVRASHYLGELSRVALSGESIVVTIKRRIAQASPCYSLRGDTVVNQDVAVLRLRSGWNPGYVAAYLNSRFGQQLADREKTEQMNPYLPVGKLGNLLIPRVELGIQEEIDRLTRRRFECMEASEDAFSQAQQLLEAELGLDKLIFQKPLGYAARFSTVGWSETFSAGRVDAQCFAPDARFYESWLPAHTKCDRLGSLLQSTAKGRQQADAADGSTDYCSIKHITGRELVEVSKCISQPDAPLARPNDLLLAITGATIGKVGIVKRYEQLAFSGDLLCLRTAASIDPHYLLLALDHKIGQVQFNRWITGSTNGHLAPRDVARVLVPRLSSETETKIAELVKNSLSKRQESEQLLEQAKARVEQLIEEAVQP